MSVIENKTDSTKSEQSTQNILSSTPLSFVSKGTDTKRRERVPAPLSSIADLPSYKGAIKALTANYSNQSIVLDLSCGDVAVVYTKAFLNNFSAYSGLIRTIEGPDYLQSIVTEYIVADDLLADLKILCDRKAQNFKSGSEIITSDNKFLVLYEEIINKACSINATDVHIEITNSAQSQIRMRVFGRLKLWKRFPTEMLRGALSAAYSHKTKAGTNSAGAMTFERATNTITEQVVGGKIINGRFNGYPLVNGYDVVIRLLDSDPKSTIPTIESLGYSKYHVHEQIEGAIKKNSGMIAISGSTGSGKSTALRAFIYAIPGRDELKIFGVEDPTEYLNPFMRQISVQRNSDDADDVVKLKFLSALRSVLRMDPDALMLGEIRDRDSASLASEFNRTGHRVFTTVHGDGCVDVLARLASEEIGIHPSTLAANKYLSAVMYQKLMPKLCIHCRIPALSILPKKTVDVLRTKFKVKPENMYCANEEGCPECLIKEVGIAGTKGLTVCVEILTPNDEILSAIRQSDWTKVENIWRGLRSSPFDDEDMAGKTAFEHALYKATQGIIDPRDIEADFESFETYEIYDALKPTEVVHA